MPVIPSSRFRAQLCRYPSDAVLIERTGEGDLRYFRRDDPAHEEYSYRKPFILEFEITRRCNLRCVHCYAHAEDRPFEGELTLAEIQRVLDQGRQIGIRELSLTGGEVFLRKDLFDIIDAGIARSYVVRLVTNGTLLDDAKLEQLCRRPIKMITVSLDSIWPAPHERIRGRGSHAPATAAIERMRDAGFHVSVITAFSRLNVEDFDALLAFCTERRIDWQVQITSAKGRCPADITLSPQEYYRLGQKVAEAVRADPPMNIIPMDDLATFSHFEPLSVLSQTWQGRCSGGRLNLFVRANGDVTPCSALCFDECVVGNVRRDSLGEICAQERCRKALDWAKADTLTGVCAECCFRQACQGGCPEILIAMCHSRTENEYCYHRIEQERILREALGDE